MSDQIDGESSLEQGQQQPDDLASDQPRRLGRRSRGGGRWLGVNTMVAVVATVAVVLASGGGDARLVLANGHRRSPDETAQGASGRDEQASHSGWIGLRDPWQDGSAAECTGFETSNAGKPRLLPAPGLLAFRSCFPHTERDMTD
jgi:hypothetical protein